MLNIVDREGCILSKDTLCRVLNMHIDMLQYNSIISAIPYERKGLIKRKINSIKIHEMNQGNEPDILIKHKYKPIFKIPSKEVYM